MLFVAFYQIFDDLLAAFNGALRGFKDTFVPMVMSLFSYWFVFLPLGYVLAEGLMFGILSLESMVMEALTFGLFHLGFVSDYVYGLQLVESTIGSVRLTRKLNWLFIYSDGWHLSW